MLSDNLSKLRTTLKLSQSDFADALSVSQQTVQKWESGTAVPTLEKLTLISNKYSVSLDELILSNNRRTTDEMKSRQSIKPIYEAIDGWESYSANLELEYHTAIEEGLDISQYRDLFMSVAKMPCSDAKERISDVLFDIVFNAPTVKDYKYNEPSTIEEIRQLRKPYEYKKTTPDKALLKNKIYGAWMGRVCGCMLGKSVEGIRSEELAKFLKKIGKYPLSTYILRSDFTEEDVKEFSYPLLSRPYVDQENRMPPDDDTNYTILYQEIIQRHGRGFTPNEVLFNWIERQPKYAYCTAERLAFHNYINGYLPPDSGRYKNAFREWIGAQIRADYFGYINPGNPEMAADMAFRDGCTSHVKNGIYGEMFVAAMLAVAAVSDSIKDIIYGGLAEIPQTSRLYEKVDELVKYREAGASKEECFAKIHSYYTEADNWCETIPNALIVVASLLCGGEDYGKSVCMAVETGFDTDCNAATVGSILGMKNGIDSIPDAWKNPINDTLGTTIFGVGEVKISDRAQMTMKHIS